MPVLLNAKHERFCQLVPESVRNGWTQGEVYQRAGYRCGGHAAEVAASRLLKNVDIQNRIAELTAPAVRKTRATIDTLAQQFDDVFDGALASAQFGAAGSAAAAKAKLLGFMRERLEVGGPGDFAALESIEEIVAKVRGELGDDAAHCVAIALDGKGPNDVAVIRFDIRSRVNQLEPAEAISLLDELRAVILRRAADRAVIVESTPAPARTDEVAAARELLGRGLVDLADQCEAQTKLALSRKPVQTFKRSE